ncbi:MAG: hypothetical protein K8T90_14920 [Planctomycetes bacterium]|nr:hypothetical protein [Planctomycetota bacterium]
MSRATAVAFLFVFAAPLAFAGDPPATPVPPLARLADAKDVAERDAASKALLDLPAPALETILRGGFTYAADAPTGWIERTITCADGKTRPYLLHVPAKYRPDKKYTFVVEMHGGVSQPKPLTHAELAEMKELWGETAEQREWIIAYPAGEATARWWDPVGSGMVLSILTDVKRTWNVDEDRVFATGFSDGGSGSYFLAAAHPTPFAGFLPLNGHPGVAAMGGLQFHTRSLSNRPIYAINTEEDSLYPSAALRPLVDAMKATGVPIQWKSLPKFRHEPTYLPAERPAIIAWMDGLRRSPAPKVVVWEGADGAPGRADWIRVTKVSGGSGKEPFADVNPMERETRVRLGVQMDETFAGPGARITLVVANSLAESMGLAADDVILAIDGTELSPTPTDGGTAGTPPSAPIPASMALRRTLAKKTFGSAIKVRVLRGTETVEKTADIPVPPEEPTFARDKPWGSLRAEVKGNRIDVTSLGIASFEVFLGNGLTDPSKPVEVAVNGKVVHSAVVGTDTKFMLSQWLEDRDRSLVYTAKLSVEVK